jgi:hypothetical protein
MRLKQQGATNAPPLVVVEAGTLPLKTRYLAIWQPGYMAMWQSWLGWFAQVAATWLPF